MKPKARIVLSILAIFAWLMNTNAFMPVAYAAPAHPLAASASSTSGSDPDHDGLTNKQEKACGTNPKKADTDKDGIRDGADDTDHDGLSNLAEFLYGTKCRSKDSDRDGMWDGAEIQQGKDPTHKDMDEHSPNHSENH